MNNINDKCLTINDLLPRFIHINYENYIDTTIELTVQNCFINLHETTISNEGQVLLNLEPMLNYHHIYISAFDCINLELADSSTSNYIGQITNNDGRYMWVVLDWNVSDSVLFYYSSINQNGIVEL